MDPPSLLSFFLAIFYFLFFPQISVSQEDKSFRECAPRPFNCGNVVNVTYPFLAENRSDICGYKNLTLACVKNSTEIEIGSQKYQIKRIDYPNRLLTVVPKDFVENDCPRPSRNTSFGEYLFDFTDKDQKLTLLYDCPLLISNSDFHEISCLKGVTSGVSSYFWIGSVGDLPSSPNKSTSWSNYCRSVVQVSLLGSGLDQLKWNASSYGKEMKEGFEVRWIMGAGWCTQCVESGGICGVNRAVPEESTCFCHDKPSFATCGAPPSGKNDDKTRRNIKIVIGVSAGAGSFILAWFFFYLLQWFRRKRRLQKASSVLLSRNVSLDPSSKYDLENYSSTNYATQVFSYRELQEATNNFDSSNEVGDGGFGTVYYGKLRDGRCVAVKRLYENNYKRVEQFMNEIKILSCLRHRNLVSLYGCNARHSRELLLVYEFIPNGTVADHLHGDLMKNGALTWPVRMNIAIETAEALAYLHAVEPQIIHRDVKTNNILLDINFSVKVADFGLSRLFPTDVTHVSTTPQGTPGYVDPDYHKCYQLTDKSDVYSFGVVLMELVSSKPAVDITRHRHEVNLSTMAINKIHNQALHELVDLSLGFESDSRVRRMMTSVAELAFQCLQEEKEMRPSMEEVLKILKGIDSAVHDVEKKQMRDAGNPVDTIGLMVNNSLHSPDSVINTWDSKSSTPYTSG